MSFARVAASAAIFILVSTVCAASKPIVTTGDTNLRKSPGTDSPVLTLLTKGTSIEVGNAATVCARRRSTGRTAMSSPAMSAWQRPRPRRGPAIADQIVDEDEPPVVYGPRPYVGPLYYGYGPYYGYYGGWGYRGGWGRRW